MMVVGRILGIELIVKCAEFRPLLGLPTHEAPQKLQFWSLDGWSRCIMN